MSEDDLLEFKDYLVMSQKSLCVGKHKALAVLSSVVGLLTVGAGVTLAVLFLNPVTIAVLGGLAVLSNKRNPKKTLEKMKDKTKQKETI